MKRYPLLLLGHLTFALGAAGIFIPGLPTVPLWLVAAWAYARSSPKFEAMILNHPRYGAAVRDWRAHGVIPPRAKLAAGLCMVLSLIVLIYVSSSMLLPTIAAVCMTGAYAFIITRPSTK